MGIVRGDRKTQFFKKIEIFVDGKYVATTERSKTCKEAKARFLSVPWVGLGKVNSETVKCSFKRD